MKTQVDCKKRPLLSTVKFKGSLANLHFTAYRRNAGVRNLKNYKKKIKNNKMKKIPISQETSPINDKRRTNVKKAQNKKENMQN